METININDILERQDIVAKMKQILIDFETQKHTFTFKKGIYIYGDPGSGKTSFVLDVLKQCNYDVIKYDAGDIRNKSIIDTITKHNMSDKNIMSMFHRKIQKIVILMDEIDGMNNGDKGGINSLIKLIRPKKTKKQKLEENTMNPIVCIGNYFMDKKIKELIKVCHVIEIKTPTAKQVTTIVNQLMPQVEDTLVQQLVSFSQFDLRKVNTIYQLYKSNQDILKSTMLMHILQKKTYNDDTKKITQKMFQRPYTMDEHLTMMNDTDRTIVALLWHENIVDIISKKDAKEKLPFYLKILENMCYADYIDRITFQKQIWQFNEMSSLIKTMQNNRLFHSTFPQDNSEQETKAKHNVKMEEPELRFTKVLTKYSTEYNNTTFVQMMCQKLGMDKRDMYAFFMDTNITDEMILSELEKYDIDTLETNRMYRYIEKYTKENAHSIEDEVIVETYSEEPVQEE